MDLGTVQDLATQTAAATDQHWDALIQLVLSLPAALAGVEAFRKLEQWTKLGSLSTTAKFWFGGLVAFASSLGISVSIGWVDSGVLQITIAGLTSASLVQHGGQFLWQWLAQHRAHRLISALDAMNDVAAAVKQQGGGQ